MGMKQYRNRIRIAMYVCAVLLMFGLITMRTYAESGDGFLLDESGNITLVSDHAAKEGLSSLQFSLAVNAPEGTEVSFEFAVSNADVCEYRYDENRKVLNVYMAGKNAMFEDDAETLTLGRVKISGNGNSSVAVSVVPDSLKYVYGTEVKTMEGVSLPEGVLLENTEQAELPPAEPTTSPTETTPPSVATTPPPAETPPPANTPGADGGQNSPSNGASGDTAHGTGTTTPPSGSSSGSTANGNTPEPVNTYYPQRTPDPQQGTEEGASAEPEVTGTEKPDRDDDMTPVMNDPGEQDEEKGKNTDRLLPIVLGVTAALCMIGFSLIAVALRRNKKKEEC